MKALLLSRPGDFGSLEDHWPGHPLTLPILGKPLFQQFADYFQSLGIREVRLLRAGPATLSPADLALETQLKKTQGVMEWSVRAWPQGPYPHGKTLPEILREQRLFQDGEEVLVLSAPLLPLSHLTGPRVPPLFPTSTSRLLAPRVLSPEGLVSQTAGAFASLVSPLDFYRSLTRLLSTVPPQAASLRGVHRRALLEAPLLLGSKIRIDAHAKVGPETALADRVRVEKGARVERCLVLTRVRIGVGAEFRGKIIIGTTVLDPENGGGVSIQEPSILRVP